MWVAFVAGGQWGVGRSCVVSVEFLAYLVMTAGWFLSLEPFLMVNLFRFRGLWRREECWIGRELH